MGDNAPKSKLDRDYREAVRGFLRGVMDVRDWKIGDLAEAMGLDRSVVSRYLAASVRAPIHRLQYLERETGIVLPKEIEEAFWRSERAGKGGQDKLLRAIREVRESLTDTMTPDEKAETRRQLEGLLRKVS